MPTAVGGTDSLQNSLARDVTLALLSDAEGDCVTSRTEYESFGDCVALPKRVPPADGVLRADRLTEDDLEVDIDELALALVRTLRESRAVVVCVELSADDTLLEPETFELGERICVSAIESDALTVGVERGDAVVP